MRSHAGIDPHRPGHAGLAIGIATSSCKGAEIRSRNRWPKTQSPSLAVKLSSIVSAPKLNKHRQHEEGGVCSTTSIQTAIRTRECYPKAPQNQGFRAIRAARAFIRPSRGLSGSRRMFSLMARARLAQLAAFALSPSLYRNRYESFSLPRSSGKSEMRFLAENSRVGIFIRYCMCCC